MIDSDECYRWILFAELLVVIAIISEEVSHFMDKVISTCIDIVIVQLLPSLGNSFLVPNIPQLLYLNISATFYPLVSTSK